MALTLGSLFDGIGGFPLAAELAGIKPVWAAEIDPFCVAVTKKRFPEIEHLGSVTEIDGTKIKPVDIITFGSPCQDLSTAGKRAGLAGERSGLFLEAVRIIYEMRSATNGKYPTFILWENVPGAFSSNQRRDFRTVLEELTKTDIPMPGSGRWATAGVVRGGELCVAWRQLDAQYWGVPQRRKRIYLVGSFGSNRAEKILFERDGVRRYLAKNRESWQRATPDVESSVNVCCCDARGNGGKGIAPTMTGDHNGHISDYTAILTYNICSLSSTSMKSDNPHSGAYETETARTLDSNGGNPFCNQGGIVVCASDRTSFNQGKNACFDFDINDSDMNSTLVAKGSSAVAYSSVLRRLTPLECERLQGYPDYWTTLPKIDKMTDDEVEFYKAVYLTDKKIRGKTAKTPSKAALISWYNKLDNDGNRYRALGNSLAIPCALRVIEGIAKGV